MWRAEHGFVLSSCIALQAILTFCYAVTLHYEFKTSGADILAFVQPLHNCLHGNGFIQSTAYPFVPQYKLATHFSPILYLFIPVYYLFPHVETLLAIGSAAVALAAWPLFLLASEILGNSEKGLVVTLLYLFNPFVFNGVAWNFHEVDLAPLCIGWMLWAVFHQKSRMLVALSVALMCIKEHYGLSVAGFGLLWAWRWRDLKIGLFLTTSGIALFGLILFVLMPSLSPAGIHNMVNLESDDPRYDWLTSIGGIRSNIAFISTNACWYVICLLLPLLFLPAAAFVWLLPAAADGATNVLSFNNMMSSPFSYHSIAIVPVIMVSFCHAIKMFNAQRAKDLFVYATAASIYFSCSHTVLPFLPADIWEVSEPHFDYTPENRAAIEPINVLIPENVPVSGQANVLPHLKPRVGMYTFPYRVDAEYMVWQLSFPFTHTRGPLGAPYNAMDNRRLISQMDAVLHDSRWGVVYYSHRWVLLKKYTPSSPAERTQALEALAQLEEEYQAVTDLVIRRGK